ncbi:MAG: molybdate ABC transporter substrate-binding protein [Sulfurimonas sp.]|uniref:molybdate ABC transporter substrate-binding protein n=1 Tax=Sulfurimonas sp. TaxID=2022749 RepID=UPI0026242F09|nr:molybdate ABC transporter substrate-binding protein [Sulfurimonas sp.]MCW8895666.1 molybdate ABC transporter substrate-binding protein [Sulfurimonas sp.]MCW8955187.1 molybdate ABC transporter substrate-binding protein [Sulfurimonas sp.]MCW9066900.1 molybdate ABC transporter substrate-binding protein [Sulfurimonas sp.]
MKYLFLLLFTILTSINASDIKIAVAANVSYAIDDLIKEFNKTHPDVKVVVTLGSSGKLTAQISNGASFDLFMSANMKYPNRLYEDKIALIEPVVYAQGSLAMLSNKNIDFSKGINFLKDERIRRIAIANPKTAPYGKAAFEALQNAKILQSIKHKLVYGESIAQTVSYTLTATDIGIIAKSSLYSSRMSKFKRGVNWIEIDSKLYTPINQGIVILKTSKEAKAFYDFILSEKAKKIFLNYGYLTP